jgi:hypothetical protein
MTATDPTPQPATHASGPRAGQPVETPEPDELDITLPSMRRPGRRMVLAPAEEWDTNRRSVWAAAYRDAARRMRELGYRQAESELLGVVNSIAAGMPGQWADQPEPPAAPAQPAGDATAAAGPTPEPTGPAILGRALLDRHGRVWEPDHGKPGGWWLRGPYAMSREMLDVDRGPVREVLLVDPSVARVLDALGQWRRACCDGDDPALWADGADLALIAAWDALGEPAPDDQRRCPATHPAHGQCELYQGHRPHDDPDRRHRTGALEWLTDAEIEACGLPPLASYAGTDLQSGPANASAESAGGLAGDGWARRPLLEFAEWLETGPAETRDPDIGRQVRAVLADRDLHVGALDTRSTQLYDALAERDAARGELARLTAELENAKADRKDLWDTRDKRNHRWMETAERLDSELSEARARLAVVSADLARFTKTALAWADEGCRFEVQRDQAQREVARLEEELVGARSECDRLERLVGEEGQPGWDGCSRAEAIRQAEQKHEFGMRMSDALETVKDDLLAAREEVDRTRLQAAEARTVADSYAEQLATARRDAAADFGAWLATEIRRLSGRINVPQWVLGRAGEIRAGTRPVPGSPEPAPDAEVATMASATVGVLGEIAAERARQSAKWGQPDHLDGTARVGDRHTAARLRAACKANGPAEDNWRDILAEEVAEAFAEAGSARLRVELIQVAAVAVAWVEAIDRRPAGSPEPAPAGGEEPSDA